MYIGQGSQLMAGLGSGEQNGVICFHPLCTQTWSDSRLLGPIHGCLSHDYTLSVEWHTTGQTAVLSSYDILAYWPLTFLLYTTLRWTYLFYNFVTRVCAFICMCDVYCVFIYGHHRMCILGYSTCVALFYQKQVNCTPSCAASHHL